MRFKIACLEQAEYYFSLLALQSQRCQFDLCLSSLKRARHALLDNSIVTVEQKAKALKLNNVHSWNGGHLLSHQQFQEGWRLFEYGLRAGAKGPQKWQRALPKPFTSAQCSVW